MRTPTRTQTRRPLEELQVTGFPAYSPVFHLCPGTNQTVRVRPGNGSQSHRPSVEDTSRRKTRRQIPTCKSYPYRVTRASCSQSSGDRPPPVTPPDAPSATSSPGPSTRCHRPYPPLVVSPPRPLSVRRTSEFGPFATSHSLCKGKMSKDSRAHGRRPTVTLSGVSPYESGTGSVWGAGPCVGVADTAESKDRRTVAAGGESGREYQEIRRRRSPSEGPWVRGT